MIEQARKLAAEKHAHLTLYNAARSPAILHIGEVAGWVEQHGGSKEMITAAWLHDIVEDTDVTLEQVEEIFGSQVAALVDGLTDPPHFAPLPLEQRKRMQAERLKEKSNDVKLIKICDQLSNVRRILNDPPVDWNAQTQFQYIKGARAVTEICRGVNAELDRLFDDAYAQAIQKYGDVK